MKNWILLGKVQAVQENILPAVSSLTHLLEKHYYKISRHPGCSKFTIAIPDIAHYIPEAFHKEPGPIAGSLNYQRCFDTGTITGFTREGTTTTFITVITERGEPSLLPPRGTISHNTELAFTDFISSDTIQTF